MVDFSKVQFEVDRIEYDGRDNACKNYVMKPTPDIHCGCPVLLDEDGNEYHVSCASQRRVSEDNAPKLVEYWFEFDEDNDPNFEVGKVLKPEAPKWKKEIPNSELVKVKHIETGIDFYTQEIFEKLEVSVDSEGNICVLRGKSKYLTEDREVSFKVSEEIARNLLDDMLACISRPDSYDTCYYDDTGREVVYDFGNGHSIRYGGTYAYGEYDKDYNDTVQIIHEFLKEVCNTNVFRTGYSGKTLSEKLERVGAETGKKVELTINRAKSIKKKTEESLSETQKILSRRIKKKIQGKKNG